MNLMETKLNLKRIKLSKRHFKGIRYRDIIQLYMFVLFTEQMIFPVILLSMILSVSVSMETGNKG